MPLQSTDKRVFAQLVAGVYEFYRKDCSAITLAIWWQALQPFDLAAVRDAFGKHCLNPDNGQWLPMPADVVRMLGGTTLDSALLAWSKVAEAVQRLGSYYTVAFDDALIHVVLQEMGGWTQVCSCTLKEWPFKQTEFCNRYRSYKARHEIPPYLPRLAGFFDSENGRSGYEVGDTYLRLIGDKAAAQQVMLGGSDVPRLGITPAAALLPEMAEKLADKRTRALPNKIIPESNP